MINEKQLWFVYSSADVDAYTRKDCLIVKIPPKHWKWSATRSRGVIKWKRLNSRFMPTQGKNDTQLCVAKILLTFGNVLRVSSKQQSF